MTRRVGDPPAPANPLQLGQRAYEVSEAAILAVPKQGSTATFQRVTFAPPSGGPGVTIAATDKLDLAPLANYADLRAAHDPEGAAEVLYGLQQPSDGSVTIDRIAGSGDGVVHSTLTPPLGSVQRLAGILPAPPGFVPQAGTPVPVGPLLAAGFDGTSVVLYACDATSGGSAQSWTIPVPAAGNVLAAELIRRQRDCWVLLLLDVAGTLTGCAFDAAALSESTVDSSAITTVDVGPLPSSPSVSVASAQLVSSTSDEQLAAVYGGADAAVHLALLGFGPSDLEVFATTTVTSFGAPERACYAIAAADLNRDGADEIVVGYPVTYGNVGGCAGLVLYSYVPDTTSSGTLKAVSTYAACAPNTQPLASIDLHLAAGMFGADSDGTTLFEGVLVLGCGASFADVFKGQAEVMAGVVAVDPSTSAFPPLEGGQPAPLPFISTLAEVDDDTPRFLAAAVDLSGLSVTLGTPSFTQAEGKSQFLGILTAPPYDEKAASGSPSVTFTKLGSTVVGLNVSSSKTFAASTDVGEHIGVSGQTLSDSVARAYGTNFDKNVDASTTTGVTQTTTLTDVDMLLVYATDYWVWEYPVFRPAISTEQSGTLLVIFPATPDPIQSSVPAYEVDYGYVQPFENGVLLSYTGLSHDGYSETDPTCLLFDLSSIAVTQDTGGGTSITYDQTKTNSSSVNLGYTLHNTASDSAHFAAASSWFEYLPVSFGLNVSTSQSYTDSDLKTTVLVRTDSLIITITGGSVSDVGYDYEITPYIYQHETLGCTVIAYDVALTGAGWADLYPDASPMLVRPYRASQYPLLSGWSRSIGFVEDETDVSIAVSVFNAGYSAAANLSCTAWEGEPTVNETQLVPPTGEPIGSASAASLDPLARTTLTIPWPAATANQAVTVTVSHDVGQGTLNQDEIAWNAYPPAYAATVMG